MTTLFPKTAFIGIGLIGASLALAMREKNISTYITAFSKTAETCATAKQLGIVDEACHTDISKVVADADLIVLALPVGAYAAALKQLAPHIKKGAIITDVGSVKASVITQVEAHLPEDITFVPAHPIAGTEHSGPAAGFASLFEKRWCIITPSKTTTPEALEKVKTLWERVGSNVALMEATHHDLTLAITSHLPHLIAYTIVGTAVDLEDNLQEEVCKYAAGGFRDFTRIAASDPIMWRDIFLHNKEAILEILGRFTEDLTALQKAIRREDGTILEEHFTRTRAIRREVLAKEQ